MDSSRFAECLEENKTADLDFEYGLYGVIEHRGPSINAGHYISYVKHKEQWLCLNDRSVTRVSAEEVHQKQAYILFYSFIKRAPTDAGQTPAAAAASHVAARSSGPPQVEDESANEGLVSRAQIGLQLFKSFASPSSPTKALLAQLLAQTAHQRAQELVNRTDGTSDGARPTPAPMIAIAAYDHAYDGLDHVSLSTITPPCLD